MADSKLVLPGDFDAGKTYLLKGETLLAWRKALLADRAIPGPGLTETGTPGGRLISAKPGGLLPVFWPQFYPGEIVMGVQTYFFTVTPGWITDRDTKGGAGTDAIASYDVPSLFNLDGSPHEFPILEGESVFIKTAVLKTGAIGTDEPGVDPCTVGTATEGDDSRSIHYVPPMPANEGAAGYYLYKLATLTIVDGEIVPDYCLAGSHIDHYRDLPMFKMAAGQADVFKEYNLILGKYLTRGLTGGSGITVTERTDDILIEEDVTYPNLNLEVWGWQLNHDGAGHLTAERTTGALEIHYWRNGHYVGNLPPDDPDGTLLNVRSVSHLYW